MPNIVLVTCSGPDDQNDPIAMADLANADELMEVAVQASARRTGLTEYPSLPWIQQFSQALTVGKAALHINGAWTRCLASGQTPLALLPLLEQHRSDGRPVFERLQWNFSVKTDAIDKRALTRSIAAWLDKGRKIVLQHNEDNAVLVEAIQALLPIDVLFDASLGLGVSPAVWPMPIGTGFVAYAGGICPETLETTLMAQDRVAPPGRPIGIDAQRGLRDPTGQRFDPLRAQALVAGVRHYAMRGGA